MSNILFDDLCQGLKEAIDYEKGKEKVRTTTYTVLSAKKHSEDEILSIQKNQNG